LVQEGIGCHFSVASPGRLLFSDADATTKRQTNGNNSDSSWKLFPEHSPHHDADALALLDRDRQTLTEFDEFLVLDPPFCPQGDGSPVDDDPAPCRSTRSFAECRIPGP
jgi:hypothetical protein